MKRLLVPILAAAVVALSPGGAMATKGNCDPGPGNFNELALAKGNGAIVVDARYGWDGVSVYPNCDGPLLGARVTNTSVNQTWYAVFPRPRRPQAPPLVITIGPGFDTTYTPAALSKVGLDSIADLEDFNLVDSPPS